MAGAVHIPDEAETRAKWGGFTFSPAYKAKADVFIGRYPAGRQQSAVMALLDLAQRLVASAGNRICRKLSRHAVYADL